MITLFGKNDHVTQSSDYMGFDSEMERKLLDVLVRVTSEEPRSFLMAVPKTDGQFVRAVLNNLGLAWHFTVNENTTLEEIKVSVDPAYATRVEKTPEQVAEYRARARV